MCLQPKRLGRLFFVKNYGQNQVKNQATVQNPHKIAKDAKSMVLPTSISLGGGRSSLSSSFREGAGNSIVIKQSEPP